MKKLIINSLLLLLSTKGMAQFGEAQIYGGPSISYLSFQKFDSFVDTYNNNEFNDPPTKALKMKSLGGGFTIGGMYQWGNFISGIQLSQLRTLQSKAEFGPDQTRVFQFRNYNFDFIVGCVFGEELNGFGPYVTMSIGALNIHSWYEYQDNIKSYGSETFYSGVWTSWKMNFRFGLRYQHLGDRWGYFADVSLPINKTEYLGGGFDESSSTTDSRYFPAYANQSTLDAITGGLKESYRQFIGTVGIIYRLKLGED